MRDLFINALDKLVGVIVVLSAVAIVISALMVAVSGQGGGILPAIGVLIFGTLYLILIGGGMYLGLGIYHNTRRMADAMDRSAPR